MKQLTHFHYEVQTCPRCLHEEEKVVWDLVDVSSDPDLKDRLLKKELHTYCCEMCGELLTIQRPCLYLEQALPSAIFYYPEVEISADWQAVLDELTPWMEIHGTAADRPWILRSVHSLNDLLEKVHALTAGLDDRVLAVVKVALRSRYREDEGIDFLDLHFLAASDTAFLFSVDTAEQGAYILEVEPDVYLRAEETLQGQLEVVSGPWMEVDEAWAVEWLNRQAE